MTINNNVNWHTIALKGAILLFLIFISASVWACEWKVVIQNTSNNSYQEILPGGKKNPIHFALTEKGHVFANCVTYKEKYLTSNDSFGGYEYDPSLTPSERVKQMMSEGTFVEKVELIFQYKNSKHYVRTSGLKFENNNSDNFEIIIGHLLLSARTDKASDMTDIIVSCFKK
ncbi:hypothetical protein [Thiohalophilus sp.]|uniref:hypothetical protein n=1 Tax=Thiohalophilus sp. TaxID=3028392 RepID=UPI002ACEAF2B|nr:hypothetical protein [Thiohalophilus sp.]MDZ7805369.1 hypothetical protein [Thiohalophilus sp.]